MGQPRNILFIMADQLRFDYLGYAGHPTQRTPNIDALAARGVNFTNTFVQAAVCGPSRASFYTGRYAMSHGATYNNYPHRPDELGLGDYLRPLGVRTALAGKTHMKPDVEGMKRLGLDPAEGPGQLVAELGFEPFDRDDGLHQFAPHVPPIQYEAYLRSKGYQGTNLWHEIANSVSRPDGKNPDGWLMRNCCFPAVVAEEDSETAYMTRRAMEFVEQAGDQPWCLHLSYIKPHWPYIAPAPWHAAYSADDVLPGNRGLGEGEPHPVTAAYRRHEESAHFRRDECRHTVIPAYMGLIEQIDHHVGRMVAFLDQKGLLEDTVIVVTSDHGDYLGDHGLGEKELYFEEALRIPLLIIDPSAEGDATRGQTVTALTESIDLIPTMIALMGGEPTYERLEGRSLLPWLHGETPGDWRDAVFAEHDFSLRHARHMLELEPWESRSWMIRTDRWKFIRHHSFRPELYDLKNDPDEQQDLGTDAGHENVRHGLSHRLLDWFSTRRTRVTRSEAQIAEGTGSARKRGVLFGMW